MPGNLINKIFFLLFLLALCLPGSVRAADDAASLPVIHSDIIRNNARITFEWPEPVDFTANAKGKRVSITFDRPIHPDFGSLLISMYPFITSAEQEKDNRTIVLRLNKPYKIRTFISDNIGGIDLLGIDPTQRHTVAKAESSLARLAPSAGTEPANATNVAEAAPTQNNTAEAPKAAKEAPAHNAPEAPKATEAVKKPPANTAPETPKADAAGGDSAAINADNGSEQPAASADPNKVKVLLSAEEDSATLRLPFANRRAIAVFMRQNYLWVVLDKTVTMDLSDFKDMPKTVVGKPEFLHGAKNIIRLPLLDDTVRPSVAKEDNSFEWAILLTGSPKPPASPLKVNINTDPPVPPHVFINTLEMSDPLTVRDPVVGDEMIVTPLFKAGEAVSLMREFVEFSLLETAQGIVIAKKADDVSVIPLRNGLRIALPQGATLTPGLPEVSKDMRPQTLQSVATFYPYSDWKLDADPPRRKQINALFHAIVEAPSVEDANEHRVRLAQVYLGEGLAAEAIGLLDGVNRTNPVYYKSARLAALRGAANFLMGRYQDAQRDFAAAELNHNKEMDFWRNMLADMNGKPGKYDYMEMNSDYISKYPPIFRQRIAIVAADRAVEAKEYNTALKIFETLRVRKDAEPLKNSEQAKGSEATKTGEQGKTDEQAKTNTSDLDDLIAPITPYINYLMAKISVETDQLQDGLSSWNALANDFTHPYVQARAEFSRTVWQVNHSALTKTQAIDKLEKLRIVWHGDSLELRILTLLGDLYNDQKDYINAMRIWDDGINSFPETTTALDMTNKLQEAFIRMFSEGSADTLSNLDALTIFYQYKKYAPPGSVGRDLIERLANRLIALDLLDQAASLLQHEMYFESEKVQRSQLGAKVATIHLMNHQPKKALEALQDSVYGENPAGLRQLRNRLAAQALYEEGENDRAWLILGQDSSPDGDRIRLNIYWERRDWKEVISIVENMLKARKDLSAPITVEESEYVLKLALAYIFENNTVQLQYLHDYFEPLMTNNPNRKLFEYITAADVAPTPGNFDEILRKLSETRSFIDNYKARIKLSGLEAIVPPVSAKH